MPRTFQPPPALTSCSMAMTATTYARRKGQNRPREASRVARIRARGPFPRTPSGRGREALSKPVSISRRGTGPAGCVLLPQLAVRSPLLTARCRPGYDRARERGGEVAGGLSERPARTQGARLGHLRRDIRGGGAL